MRAIWLLLVSLLFVACAQEQKPVIEVKMHHGAYYDLFANEKNITHFPPWQNIDKPNFSFDSSYFFIRHKADSGGAYRLRLYQTYPLKQMAEIVPGYGGSFEWNANNQIIHHWGCGSNCSPLAVYNLELNQLLYTISSGGFVFNPDLTAIVERDQIGHECWIYNLDSLALNKPHSYNHQYELLDSINNIRMDEWSLQFLDNQKLEISSPEGFKPKKVMVIDLKQLSFKN